MATGNEFQQPGDKGIGKPAEQGAENKMHQDSHDRVAVVGHDAAKQQALNHCGPMDKWMSQGHDPEGFKAKTADMLAQTPEKMAEFIKSNEKQIEAVQKLIASAEAQIAKVLKAEMAHYEIEKANRAKV